MSKESKTHKSSDSKLHLPKDFHWKLMWNFCEDMCNSTYAPYVSTDLKEFRSAVRMKDIKRYLSNCKKQWSLRFQLTNVNGSNRSKEEDLKIIRGRRLLTIFQKFDFPGSPYDKESTAIETFRKFESKCSMMNHSKIFVIDKNDNDDQNFSSYDNLVTSKHIKYVRKFISRTLGVEPNLEDFLKALRHGPGASTDKRGNNSVPLEKFIPPIGVSPNAQQLFKAVLATDQRWTRSIHDFWCAAVPSENLTLMTAFEKPCIDDFITAVERSTIITVPKSADVDRTISIEPTANVYLQLAVDSIVRKSLKKLWGIDINTQEKNQKLAQIGSETNKLVTIDLSGASDSISLNWLNLFPRKWAKLLAALRMNEGILPNGEIISFHKLSAMGNGFTFAIETLIFSAIVYAVLKTNNIPWSAECDNIAIYGDDIIIPSKYYSEYSYLLHKLGFTENVEKTFSWGPIRESCGYDFFHGNRIDRPTIKAVPKMKYELFILYNKFAQIGRRFGIQFDKTLNFIQKYIPLEEQNFGPPSEDLVGWLQSESPPTSVKSKYDRNWQGLYFKIKRNVVGHPTRFKKDRTGKILLKDIPKKYRYFLPMMFLNNGASTSSCTDYLENISLLSCSHVGVVHREVREQYDYGLFIKNIIVTHTTTIKIPVQEWM